MRVARLSALLMDSRAAAGHADRARRCLGWERRLGVGCLAAGACECRQPACVAAGLVAARCKCWVAERSMEDDSGSRQAKAKVGPIVRHAWSCQAVQHLRIVQQTRCVVARESFSAAATFRHEVGAKSLFATWPRESSERRKRRHARGDYAQRVACHLIMDVQHTYFLSGATISPGTSRRHNL